MLRPIAYLATATVLLSSASAAAPQSTAVHTLLRQNETLSNGDTYLITRNCALGDEGTWAAIVGTSAGRAALLNGTVVAAEGVPYEPPSGPIPGAQPIAGLVEVRVDTAGRFGLLYRDEPSGAGPDIARVAINGNVFVSRGDLVPVLDLGVSVLITGIDGFDFEGDEMVLAAGILTPAGGQIALMTGTLSGGSFVAQTALLRGDSFPGTTSEIERATAEVIAAGNGRVGGALRLERAIGSTFNGLVFDDDLIAEAGQAGPAPNSTWTFDVVPRVRANRFGTTVVSGTIQLPIGASRGAIYQGTQAIAIEGDVVGSEVVAPFDVADIAITENNEVFYTVPFVGGQQRLLAGPEVLIETLVTVSSGGLVTSLISPFLERRLEVSSDGRSALVIGTTSPGGNVLMLMERSIWSASPCAQNPNSTGQAGRMAALGSRFLSINSLTLNATRLPQSQFGMLLVASDAGFTAMPGGSEGNLCLGGDIGRYVGQIQSSGLSGSIEFDVDLTAIPRPMIFAASMRGDLWRFQTWHRDNFGAGPSSCFTRAISITVF